MPSNIQPIAEGLASKYATTAATAPHNNPERETLRAISHLPCITAAENLVHLRRFFRRSRGRLHPATRNTGARRGPRAALHVNFYWPRRGPGWPRRCTPHLLPRFLGLRAAVAIFFGADQL